MPRPRKHDGVLYRRSGTKIWWMRYRDRVGKRRLESTFTDDWDEAQKRMRERLQARDDNTLEVIRKGERLLFSEWADFFLENYSQPPVLSPKAHDVNVRMVQNLRKAFDEMKMADITADGIEAYLRFRLRQPKRVKTAIGYRELGKLKPSTVHQEFSGAPAGLERRGEKEADPGQSLCWGGVPREDRWAVSAALHELVGAAED